MQDKKYSVSYEVDLAKEYDLPVAILVTNVRYFTAMNRAENKGHYFHSMKAIAEATGLSYRQIREAAHRAKEAGLIDYWQDYKPGTTEKTTYWDVPESHSGVVKTATSGAYPRATSLTNINNKDINNKEIGTAEKPKGQKSNSELEKVYQHYLERFGTTANRYKLTEKRRTKLKSRLQDCGAEMLCEAIDHAKEDYWYSGDNQRGWKADLDFIIRSYENVEKLANLQPRRRQLSWQEQQAQQEQEEFDRKFRPIEIEPELGLEPELDQEPEPFSDEFIEEMRQRALGGKRKEQEQ